MGFVKEKRLAALSSVLYITSTFDDTTSTWASLDVKFPETIYGSTYSNGWTTEKRLEFNTFEYMGRNTDNDVLIEEDDLHWENLTDYTWSKLLPRVNLNWEGETTNWELTWQEWRPDFETTGTPSSGDGIDDRTGLSLTASSLATLDGNWESKVQTDKTETVIDNQFFKYSWAGLNSTWDSLT